MSNHAIFDINVKSYLQSQNIKYDEVRQGWLKMPCLFPDHDDNNPSFYINTIHRGYNCYGCGRNGKLSELFTLLGWEVSISDSIIVGIDVYKWDRFKEKMSVKKVVDEIKRPPVGFKIISREDRKCRKHYRYMENRNILDCIEPFKVGYTLVDDREYRWNYKQRVLIPVHNSKGKCVFIEGRLITEQKKRKYYRQPGANKNNILFNLHRVKRMKKDFVIVTEGIIDAMVLHVNSYPAVGCFGSKLSIDQMTLLSSFNSVYFCFDLDKAGIKAYVDAKKRMKDFGIELFRIKLPRNEDVNSIGIKKFEKYYRKAEKVY